MPKITLEYIKSKLTLTNIVAGFAMIVLVLLYSYGRAHATPTPLDRMITHLEDEGISFVYTSGSTVAMPNYPYGRTQFSVRVFLADQTPPLYVCKVADAFGVRVDYVENTKNNEAMICHDRTGFVAEPEPINQLEWVR